MPAAGLDIAERPASHVLGGARAGVAQGVAARSERVVPPAFRPGDEGVARPEAVTAVRLLHGLGVPEPLGDGDPGLPVVDGAHREERDLLVEVDAVVLVTGRAHGLGARA